MSPSTLEYSIIVPTHNKERDVLRCLEALLKQERGGRTLEIIVVNDGSSDGTREALESFDSRGIPFCAIHLPGFGPAAARNQGIKHARGAVVCMIDDDAVPEPGWFVNLVQPFEADVSIVGVEGKVLPTGEDFGILGMSPRNYEGGVYLTCSIAYRRNALLKVGGFDEGFPYPAFEDADLALALEPFGKIAFAADSVVYHPRRRWTLKRAIYEIRFNEALLRLARRYRCLGWTDRPTGWPRLRVCMAAMLTLPLGRVLRGLRGMRSDPVCAGEYVFISLVQSVVAAFLMIPLLAKSFGPTPQRRSSLRHIAVAVTG